MVCEPDAITDAGMCEVCIIPGQVPDDDHLNCIACPLNQIEVSGACQDCPVGEVPKEDRISCISDSTSAPINMVCFMYTHGHKSGSDGPFM